MGPGSGTAIPATVALFGTEPVHPAAIKHFNDNDIHPDLWVMAQFGEIFRAIDPADAAFVAAVGQWEDPVDDDYWNMLSPREANLAYYYSEIVDQSGSFEHYFYNLLSINPRSHPATCRLIALGLSVAGVVGMHHKLNLKRPRPAQVLPGLFPFLPTPAHPSYPSNHATQSHTAALLLIDAIGATAAAAYAEPLKLLADRISVNRERAGLHYATDTAAGEELAKVLAARLAGLPLVQPLIAETANELAAGFA